MGQDHANDNECAYFFKKQAKILGILDLAQGPIEKKVQQEEGSPPAGLE